MADVTAGSPEAADAGATVQAATLQDLIRWLALPLQGREPIFAEMGVDGKALNVGLRDLFVEVMGLPTEPPAPGAWEKCESCGAWSVNSLA